MVFKLFKWAPEVRYVPNNSKWSRHFHVLIMQYLFVCHDATYTIRQLISLSYFPVPARNVILFLPARGAQLWKCCIDRREMIVRADQHMMMFLRVDIMTAVSVNAHFFISIFLLFSWERENFSFADWTWLWESWESVY